MSTTEAAPETAPVEGAIRNPANAAHFMVIQPAGRRARIYIGDILVADSRDAVRVIEIGRKVYEPRLYFPPAALTARLEKLEKTTHCPLKGDAEYYALDGCEVGWAYRALDFAAALDGLHSFWGDDMRIVEGD
ncbi:DUF427 domain-containing protein [Nisaea acidiphila]|uniref:DUF427 domain-containing protein n=1 Tax=Nisaea acidiphila TaxID=1862145 RepID=A0A9J7AWI4_9PROT|nr:DUF427 domain-containing protein [Nisaea acidiphila]UUX52171.1 DUF427 domain-containing protein [Nisaea acidiphila]